MRLTIMFLLKIGKHVRGGDGAEVLVAGKRQLVRRAFDVADEHIDVFRIDERFRATA